MTEKKKTKKKTAKKKVTKKSVKKSDNPNITRTFENGKMVVEFKNGRKREITVEQLETRKANIPTNIANRTNRIQTRIDRITNRIAGMEDGEQKTALQEHLTAIQNRKNNLPTGQELIDKIQGWIDSANASA